MSIFEVEIVNAESEIFSGEVTKLVASGKLGELEILKNHAPLLTTLSPGPVWVQKSDGTEEAFVTFGGILEVQPSKAIILADAVVYADDINAEAVAEAKKQAENVFSRKANAKEYKEAHLEIMLAAAQLRILKRLGKRL